jgi:hypothetical protein
MSERLTEGHEAFHREKQHLRVAGKEASGIICKPMTRARAIRARTATARLLAMTCWPGLRVLRAKAGSTS